MLALVLVAITAGLVAALVRPLWICFIAFALASLAVFFIWGLNLIGIVLAVLYLLAGLLYSQGVAKELSERINFSVHPIHANQTILAILVIIAVCTLFYCGYAAQIKREGLTAPPFIIDMATGIAEEQIETSPGLTSQEKEQAIVEFRQQFEQQMEDAIKPYQRFIPIGVALVLLGLLTLIVRLFSWLPTLILKAIFAILTACHVTSVVTEMQEVKRLTID